MERYFPDNVAAARFLSLLYILWTVSNCKNKFNSSHRLGNAVVYLLGDKKPQFLQALAEWIVTWDKMKISSSEKFTLSTQTSNAFQRVLRCHAAPIDPRNELFCKIHEQLPLNVISAITNVYVNNKKKRSSESVVKLRVISLKKMKHKK